MGEPRREEERSARKRRRKVDRSVDWGRGREPLRESDMICSEASLRCSRLRVGSSMQRLSVAWVAIMRDITRSRGCPPCFSLQMTFAAGSSLFAFLPSFLIRPQGRYELLHPRRCRVYLVAKALIPMFGIVNETYLPSIGRDVLTSLCLPLLPCFLLLRHCTRRCSYLQAQHDPRHHELRRLR
ncbi:hypothetical protein B0H14DRAFT_1332710 [Mycena olivaceomarginata]|nr:hypothetical protein B0H14DRAFT_1332710 [Mycena olivaceomarginata]